MTPLQQIQCTVEKRENVTSQTGYMGEGLNTPYEEREAEGARGDLGRDLNARELPEPVESPRQSSRQSWEERPTKGVGTNEWDGDYVLLDRKGDVNSNPGSLPALDTDQTVPMTLHESSANEEGNAPLCEVCQAPG